MKRKIKTRASVQAEFLSLFKANQARISARAEFDSLKHSFSKTLAKSLIATVYWESLEVPTQCSKDIEDTFANVLHLYIVLHRVKIRFVLLKLFAFMSNAAGIHVPPELIEACEVEIATELSFCLNTDIDCLMRKGRAVICHSDDSPKLLRWLRKAVKEMKAEAPPKRDVSASEVEAAALSPESRSQLERWVETVLDRCTAGKLPAECLLDAEELRAVITDLAGRKCLLNALIGPTFSKAH